MLAEYYEERDNVSDQKKIEEEELQKNIRRVQEYFGYWVDPKDPRFQLMLSELDETAKMVSLKCLLLFDMPFCLRKRNWRERS
jgi:hypothetical protein